MSRALPTLRANLLRWYDAHARDLPWRRAGDPYATWVSEIMLQQTRVDTVLGYYDRFMQRFPTTHALAAADEDAVMAAWSGLGYYRRARLLHAGVREVVERYGGEVPADAEARLSLPGVGRYTAGAIGSIAFGRAEPLVDGNVARVFCRLFGIATPLGRADTEAALWAWAAKLVKGERPGDLNQAWMELGATLCSKHAPRCDQCPVKQACVAKREGTVDALPIARSKKPPKHVALTVVVASTGRGATVLVRGKRALFGGLWNLPMAEGHGRDHAQQALAEHGVSAQLGAGFVAGFDHVLTHRRFSVELWHARRAKIPASEHLRGVSKAALQTVGISSLTRKALQWGD